MWHALRPFLGTIETAGYSRVRGREHSNRSHACVWPFPTDRGWLAVADGGECAESCKTGDIPLFVAARSYRQERTAVTQALEVAVIERVGSELDSEPDLTICWVCFILPKPMNMSTVK